MTNVPRSIYNEITHLVKIIPFISKNQLSHKSSTQQSLLTSSRVSSVRAVTPHSARVVRQLVEAIISMAKGDTLIPMASNVVRDPLARSRLMIISTL